jgi:hypothetical protein
MMIAKGGRIVDKVILTSQVGADGVLHVSLPLKPEDANRAVRVTVEPLDQAAAPTGRPTTHAEWLKFIENTAGAITDPTFERGRQGEYEQREEFNYPATKDGQVGRLS